MAGSTDTKYDLEAQKDIRNRESELWWLAVLVILLLALALFVIDWSYSSGDWWISPGLGLMLNTLWMRIVLVTAILLICLYFRNCTRKLRHRNSELVDYLSQYGKKLEGKNSQAERLRALSDRLIVVPELDQASDLIVCAAFEIANADTTSIMLRGKDDDMLRIVASRGISPDIVKSACVRVGESLAGIVARDGKAVVMNSDALCGEAAGRAKRTEEIGSSAIVPIQVGDETRGVLNVARRRGQTCFTDEDLGVLTALANQASMVIQKTDLLDDLRSKINTLAATVRELNQAQEELMQSEKLASIGQLAGGVAHEINNPLQVILGRTELLLARSHDDKGSHDLGEIIEHTTRIARTVSNLLSFSRQSTGTESRNLDVGLVVEKTLQLLEPQMAPDDIVVVRNLRQGPPVHASASQLQQVFTNIILNAYHAMRPQGGGTLTVETSVESGHVVVSFADTGHGISPEHIAHIFEPFFTTKPEGEGTGLGLSIIYGIMQSHGGSIEVDSSESGARFRVLLPTVGSCSAKTEASVCETA